MAENNENNISEISNNAKDEINKELNANKSKNKNKKPTLINIFKMKRIPIIPTRDDIGISLPTGFDIKALKNKLGIKNTNTMASWQ